MNPLLEKLQLYPFERLKELITGVTPATNFKNISFGIGEPKHPTPQFIKEAFIEGLGGLSNYPATAGSDSLRDSIARWLERRHQLRNINSAKEVLPVTGSREALFAFAQAVIDNRRPNAKVVCPNPFYQIYEGATLLAGAMPYYVDCDPARNFAPDYASVPLDVWKEVQLVYLCSPGNPTGSVLGLADWQLLFELSDQYGFIIASDECYSEIYFDEENPPLGALAAAQKLGRSFNRLVVFSSLSKRSNVPGMRSGFVAGDPAVLKLFLLYRTYHGCAMNPAVQAASIAAWEDEVHVRLNRSKYIKKFQIVTPMLSEVLDVRLPDAGFYLWACVDAKTGLSDKEFTCRLLADYNVTVLPGSYLGRTAHWRNPGENYVRIALVADIDECIEGAERIVQFCQSLSSL
ncbi:succinyldiaminopimelate transaminase [Candidatus Pandoraea novymonadis]|uniref:LL-diaminopimelate aminotransferase n=1 Tax=Candidatus Pandoraea novymonadis TaxID=1808959 RepID=A0ABX5FFC8_9BURK|nr:succinyldiaminopimelate transaminase [Candidatus Pandoraea novymonadis]PSB92041.1 LL-diaminopimelate aminotransferase [Candidatus Pandoraea novymonadis]